MEGYESGVMRCGAVKNRMSDESARKMSKEMMSKIEMTKNGI